jgi:hypothetical protein
MPSALPTIPPPRSAGAAWPAMLATLAAAVAGGFLLWSLRVPLVAGFDKWWPLPAVAAEVAPAEPPPLPMALQVAPAEKPREWTAVEIGAALRALPSELEALARDARQELRQLADTHAGEKAQRQRAEHHWQAWGRTWRNRLKLIEKRMPSSAACAKDPSKVGLCRDLGAQLAAAGRLPAADGPAAARRQTEELLAGLDRLLRPPTAE